MAEVKPTIQDIFCYARDHHLIDEAQLTVKQRKVIRDICACRTEEMGFNVEECTSCGYTQLHYNSCRNASCPMCQSFNRQEWVEREEYYKLNITYYHCVFTIPAELNPYILLDKRFGYTVLFHAVSSTLNAIAADPKYLGAKIGFTAVLHTWGSTMVFHPHIHCIISGGGYTQEDTWISKDRFLFPVRVLSSLFRGKFLYEFKKYFNRSLLADPAAFDQAVDKCYKKDWIVYTKEPFENPKTVIQYLGRYTHRIAISNARIRSFENGMVTFSYKDYQGHSSIRQMTITAREFVRRYLMHVLPQGFTKIRHYGFLANANKKKRIIRLRILTNTPSRTEYVKDTIGIITRIIGRDPRKCPRCHKLIVPASALHLIE